MTDQANQAPQTEAGAVTIQFTLDAEWKRKTEQAASELGMGASEIFWQAPLALAKAEARVGELEAGIQNALGAIADQGRPGVPSVSAILRALLRTDAPAGRAGGLR